MPFCIHKFAEIGVFGQQNPAFVAGETKNHFVGGARRDLGDSQNVVTGRANCPHYRKIATLVGHESHARTCSEAE